MLTGLHMITSGKMFAMDQSDGSVVKLIIRVWIFSLSGYTTRTEI